MIKAEIHTQAGTYYIDLPDAKDADEGLTEICTAIINMDEKGVPLKPTVGESLLIDPNNQILHIRVFEEAGDPVQVEPPPIVGQVKDGPDDFEITAKIFGQKAAIKGRVYGILHPTGRYLYIMPTTVNGRWAYDKVGSSALEIALQEYIGLHSNDYEILMPPPELDETTDSEELDAYLVDFVKESEAEKARPVGEKTAKAALMFGYDKHQGTEE